MNETADKEIGFGASNLGTSQWLAAKAAVKASDLLRPGHKRTDCLKDDWIMMTARIRRR